MRKFILLSVLALFVSVVHAATQPNVIIVMTDDQGYTDMAIAGDGGGHLQH